MKGESKEVLDYIQQDSRIYDWNDIDRDHRFSKRLLKIYPEIILQRYWDEVHKLIKTTREKYYYQAAAVLNEIEVFMTKNGQAESWQMKYNALLAENSRRRLFLKIVNRG